MKTPTVTLDKPSEQKSINMVDFYNEATEDYEFWSKDFNMHFGYFILFKTNLFRRDSMLNQMNAEVLKRLNITSNKHRLADFGCGMGATMRHALKHYKNLIAYGLTLSHFQHHHGNKLLKGKNGIILQENYNHTSFENNTFDSVIAIESFCHSGHSITALNEASRILKSGGKIVIADAFLKKSEDQLCHGSRYAYHKLCTHWSLKKLETIDNYKRLLEKAGFTNVSIENKSFRVAPSVLHVPFAIIGFTIKQLMRTKSLKRESLHNLKGSFYALLSGLHMKSFAYYLITATKK